MPLPKKTDFNSDLEINSIDAVKRIFESAGQEQIALSQMLNAESKKIRIILCAMERKKSGDVTNSDIPEIFRSVEKTLRYAIKTEMLIQFKLREALEFAADYI